MTESSFQVSEESFIVPSSYVNTEALYEDLDPKDLEIERLKKANFSLRLRVFHLEGCLNWNKDNEQDLHHENTDSKLLEELQQEIEKKDELLLKARDMIRSLKTELVERSNKQETESLDPGNSSFSYATKHDVLGGLYVNRDDPHKGLTAGEVPSFDYNSVMAYCGKVVEKLISLSSENFKEELEAIHSQLTGEASVEMAFDVILQFLDFMNRFLASLSNGEYFIRSNAKVDSLDIQTDPVTVVPPTFMSTLIKLLRYLVNVRLQLQGTIQVDETSQPSFPETDDESVADEVLKLLTNEVVDWDQLVYHFQLVRDDLSLTRDALEEAENLRDEAIEALEATEMERDTAMKLIESLKELALVTASSDLVSTERILEEFTVDSDSSMGISNEWKAQIQNQVKLQNEKYQQLEKTLMDWRERWDSLTCDQLHYFSEDGTFTCLVKEEKDNLEQRIHDLLKVTNEERDSWNERYEALKEERDLEVMRCQELEDESVRMIEEQVELHRKKLEQLENKLYERTKIQETLEQELKDAYDTFEYCKMKTTSSLDMMLRFESFLSSLDESIQENIQVDSLNEEALENSYRLISQLKQRITSADEETRGLVYMFQAYKRSFDSKLYLLDKESSRLECKWTKVEHKAKTLREELFRRNQKVEEQQRTISLLEEQIQDKQFQFECKEEEYKRQRAIIEEEKESTLNELSACREEYRMLYDEWLELCNHVDDITSTLEQHEAFSKQVEEEKENLKMSFYRVEEERKRMDAKYQSLYSLYFEMKEGLLREVKLWKTQFSFYWKGFEKMRKAIDAFQEEVRRRWMEMESFLQGLHGTTLNQIFQRTDESFPTWKPFEMETDFPPELVKHIVLLVVTIEVLCEKLQSNVATSGNEPSSERNFMRQSKIHFSIPEEIDSRDNEIMEKTNVDRETMEQFCHIIESCERWFELWIRKLLELNDKLSRLGHKQEVLVSFVKLRDVSFHGGSTMKWHSGGKEPRSMRRFSFSPATGQRVSPIQLLRWREREQEEGILRRMRDQWLETQKYTS